MPADKLGVKNTLFFDGQHEDTLHAVYLRNRAETKNHNDTKKNNDDNNANTDDSGKEDNATNAPTTTMPMAIKLTTPTLRKTKTMEQLITKAKTVKRR